MALTINKNLDILILSDEELESFANINLVGRDFNKKGGNIIGTIIKVEGIEVTDYSQRFIKCRLHNGDLYRMQDIEFSEQIRETELAKKHRPLKLVKSVIPKLLLLIAVAVALSRIITSQLEVYLTFSSPMHFLITFIIFFLVFTFVLLYFSL